jgi:DNA polymerase III subunit gamma/tau
MKTLAKLNLTRKWRSKTFDTIVGQDISVRILKNSLYLDQVFPVYLFSGQRGCGKTTTARVFTAAVNCLDLASFRKNPKNTLVPCLKCVSCIAMESGKHPDFTEIDAASHTGVDNIRQLIETTTFLPQMGSKKVYLIDEVHMLSKAAFNALLKILEEPPPSVIFILATTDPHKVIDTVKSRCFQLFFGPPKTNLLLQHLQHVCKVENIEVEIAALSILIREADGSVRDAMNLLEQVRFIEPHVTVKTVSSALGYVADSVLLNLIELYLANSNELPSYLVKLDLAAKNIEFIWKRLCELLKMVLYTKHGVVVDAEESLLELLNEIANKFTLSALVIFLDHIARQELILLKTAHKALVLELFFLQGSGSQESSGDSKPIVTKIKNDTLSESKEILVKPDQKKNESVVPVPQGAWQQMIGLISQCGDPILISIFKQAQFVGVDENKLVSISFSEQFSFFEDLIIENKTVWQKFLLQVFGEQAFLKTAFDGKPKEVVRSEDVSQSAVSNQGAVEVKKKTSYQNGVSSSYQAKRISSKSFVKKQVDVSDKQKWPLVNQILEHFPGQVYEVSE